MTKYVQKLSIFQPFFPLSFESCVLYSTPYCCHPVCFNNINYRSAAVIYASENKMQGKVK